MPLYEYVCPRCGRKYEELHLAINRYQLAPLCQGDGKTVHECCVTDLVHSVMAPTPAIDHMGTNKKPE